MDLDMDFGWLWMSPCGWRRWLQSDRNGYRIWMAVGETRNILQSDRNGYGFWMAVDESIGMERVDVMWCRLWNRMRNFVCHWNSGIL